MKPGWLMGAKQQLLLSWVQSAPRAPTILPPTLPLTLPKSLQCEEGEGGAGIAVSVETAEIVVVIAEPTIIQITPVRIIQAPTPIPIPEIINHIKKDLNIQIYLPVLAGPVPSTGRRGSPRPTVATPWSANGSTWWPPEPERSANLEL